MYRYAPSRDEPQWKWVSPGAGAAVTLWIIASIGFTVYVAHFNSYNKTYGSLGGVIILLTWLYISSFVILFGAAINAQSEKQTRKDTTVGRPEAMGSAETWRRHAGRDALSANSDKQDRTRSCAASTS